VERCKQGFGGEAKGKRPPRGPIIRQEDNIKIYFTERECMVWTGFIWLRIGTSARLL
jgi:hypothetical protein